MAMVLVALAGVRGEIEKANAGAEALDGVQQLLVREDSRTRPKLEPGIARGVVDRWPMDDPPGKLLCRTEYEYGRLR